MRTTASRITTPWLAALLLGLAAAAPASGQEPTTSSGGLEATVDRPGLTVRPAALLDRTVRVRGRSASGDAGRPVTIERQDPAGAWLPIGRDVVAEDGTFSALWKTDALGRTQLRASIEREAGSAAAASSPLTAQVTVFEPAIASWYGPGFFGRRMACGAKLTRRTVGVAHKTLPCGTLVELYHGGRTLTVPVVDRGPFVAGRDWDLTQAAADRLGVRSTVRVGFLPPRGLPVRAAASGRAAR